MSSARERIKKAHKGRETRSVLVDSTAHTVGASTWTIVRFFLKSAVLLFLPLVTSLLAIIVASYRSSLRWSSAVLALGNPHTAGLLCSIYAYWTLVCIFFVYRTRPHALNAVKHQTFHSPWRYRRDHVSHMRLDRLRRAWHQQSPSGGTPKSESPPDAAETPPDVITVFVNLATAGTIAIPVMPMTTVSDIREAVSRRVHMKYCEQGPMYLLGLWRPLNGYETMSDLGIDGLCHFLIRTRLLGGGNESDVPVLDKNGWEQGALNTDGSLKNAEDIDFGPDPGANPKASTSDSSSRPKRGKNKLMMAALIAQQEDSEDDGEPRGRKRKPKGRAARTTAKGKEKEKDAGSDAEDDEYSGDDSGDSESDSEREAAMTHEELAENLPSKTVPVGTSRRPKENDGGKRPRKKKKTQAAQDTSNSAATSNPAASSNSANPETPTEPTGNTRNPIYHFFENITDTDHHQPSGPGDKFYRCFHGESKKPLKMTKAMRSSLNGLTRHLKSHAPEMYRFWDILNNRKKPLTSEEIDVAAGRKTFADPQDLAAFLAAYVSTDTRQQTLRESFTRAGEKSLGNWDQAHFEKLLVEWLVVCDQPFQEVERPEFRRLLEYVHHRSPGLAIPGSKTVQRRVTDMGDELKKELCAFFASLEGMVSISLDAWSSSNGYAFIAIVAHYVTNDGKLEELLIDFKELIGEHSGENMADVVWKTLECYGLTGRVISFMMDNATNNDTLVSAIEIKCREKNIKFSAKNSRLRCMPHTVHLAVLQLLEAIGAVEKSTKKKNAQPSPYQDSVTVSPDDNELEEEAVFLGDEDEEFDGPMPMGIKASVRKLRKVIRAVRSSPQRRQQWYKIISPVKILDGVHMLILDVKTRWSSTHQMMNRAIKYRSAITQFVADNRDLHGAELSVQDWDAITMVSDWLLHFRSATSQMSTTSRPMLSSTHSTFRGLQKTLKDKLCALPKDAPPELVEGLTKAHRKLSDYYYKYDQSPFYIWAALLDPRFNYKKLRKDYAGDEDLSAYLEKQKAALRTYFDDEYAASSSTAVPSTPSTSSAKNASKARPGVINFAAYDQGSDEEEESDELERYFDAPRASSQTDPVQWWYARKTEFPRLYRLARDIMSIPGSAVAVERVFSGGRDTISLRRARLQPETIRTLMLLKHHLRLKRKSLEDALKSTEP